MTIRRRLLSPFSSTGSSKMTKGVRTSISSVDEEVQRSLELLDQVLSEFDEVETDNPEEEVKEEEDEGEVLSTPSVPLTDAEDQVLSKVGHIHVQELIKKGPPPWPDPVVSDGLAKKDAVTSEASGPHANGSCSSPDSLAASDGPDGGRASVSSGHHVVLLPRLPAPAGEEDNQSEDDGYISMNGGRSLPRSLEGVLSLPVVDDNDNDDSVNEVPSPRMPPPPSPAEAERLIASLLPRVSPRHCDRRRGSRPDSPEDTTPKRHSGQPASPSTTSTSLEAATSPAPANSDSDRASQGTQTAIPTQTWWIPYDPAPSPATPMTPDSECASPGCPCTTRGQFFLPLDPNFPPKSGWPTFEEEKEEDLEELESQTMPYQPVVHDRLNANHTMYFPGPPSPVPDYSPMVSDTEMGATCGGKGGGKNVCSNASLSEEDSLQDQKVADVVSVFSEDSLESEPSSLHCTWGSLAGSVDTKLDDQSPPTFHAASSEESSTLSIERNNLWISSEDVNNTSGAGDTKARWSWNSSSSPVPEEEEPVTVMEESKEEAGAEQRRISRISQNGHVEGNPQPDKPPDKQPEMAADPPPLRDHSQIERIAADTSAPHPSEPRPEKARASTDFTCIHQMLQEGLLEGLDDAPPQFKPPPPPRRTKPTVNSEPSLRGTKPAVSSEPSPRRSTGLVYPEPNLPKYVPKLNSKSAQPRLGIRMGVRVMGPGFGSEPSPTLLVDSPHRAAFPMLRRPPHHRFSTEALDKLGISNGISGGMSGGIPSDIGQDFPQKPATLPPGLTPNFHHRSSARETLRRVTSLLIRRGSSKDNKKDASSSLKPGDGSGSSSRPKRSFFKSLWRRSRQYSLEQH